VTDGVVVGAAVDEDEDEDDDEDDELPDELPDEVVVVCVEVDVPPEPDDDPPCPGPKACIGCDDAAGGLDAGGEDDCPVLWLPPDEEPPESPVDGDEPFVPPVPVVVEPEVDVDEPPPLLGVCIFGSSFVPVVVEPSELPDALVPELLGGLCCGVGACVAGGEAAGAEGEGAGAAGAEAAGAGAGVGVGDGAEAGAGAGVGAGGGVTALPGTASVACGVPTDWRCGVSTTLVPRVVWTRTRFAVECLMRAVRCGSEALPTVAPVTSTFVCAAWCTLACFAFAVTTCAGALRFASALVKPTTAFSTAWRVIGVPATTDVAATVATVAATFAPPVRKSDLSSVTHDPASPPFAARLPTDFCSSARPAASDRRARKISVSTAACETSISSAISR